MAKRLEGLDRLPLPLRIAFAAACAERVVPIFELELGKRMDAPRKAVELAWRIAMGAEVDAATVSATRRTVGDQMPDQDDEPGTTAPLYAGQTAALALQTVQDGKAASALGTANYARNAVEEFDDGGPGAKEETAWQERALQLARSWGDRPVEREMFAALGTERPAWLARQRP